MNSKYLTQLCIEAIVVGIISVMVMMIMQRTTLSPVLMIFISGMIIHLGCEATGINKWHCTNGASCMN